MASQTVAIGDFDDSTKKVGVTSSGALKTSRYGVEPALVVAATRGPVTVTGVGTSSVEVVAAPGAGLSIHVTSVAVANANATAGKVSLRDNVTARLTFPVPGNNQAGGGGPMVLDPPWKLAANSPLTAISDTASSASVNVQYYVAA